MCTRQEIFSTHVRCDLRFIEWFIEIYLKSYKCPIIKRPHFIYTFKLSSINVNWQMLFGLFVIGLEIENYIWTIDFNIDKLYFLPRIFLSFRYYAFRNMNTVMSLVAWSKDHEKLRVTFDVKRIYARSRIFRGWYYTEDAK